MYLHHTCCKKTIKISRIYWNELYGLLLFCEQIFKSCTQQFFIYWKGFFFCLTFSQTYLLHVRQKHRFGHFVLPWVFLVGVNECLLCLTFGQTIFQFWSDIVRCRALFKKIVLEYSLFVYLERMEEFLALWMWKKGNCIFTILL